MAGHEVLVAEDPAAVQATVARRFDLVLVDLNYASHTVELSQLGRKVVLFSSASEEETREHLKKSGAKGYIRKLGPQRLLEDVHHVLSA